MSILAKALLLATVSARSFTAGNVTFTVVYDTASSKYKFNVNNVAASSTFTIVFSPSAATVSSDLAVFSAIGSGTLTDKWGTLSSASTSFDSASWSNAVATKNDDGTYNWVAYRAADTGNTTKDTKIVCGATNEFSWAHVISGATTTGLWSLETTDDCSVVEPPAPVDNADSAIYMTTAATIVTTSVMMSLF